MLPSTKFLEEFEWLASQSPSFLKYFFFFTNWKWNKADDFIDHLFGDFKPFFSQLMDLEMKNLLISWRQFHVFDDKKAEAIRLARIIITKMEEKHSVILE